MTFRELERTKASMPWGAAWVAAFRKMFLGFSTELSCLFRTPNAFLHLTLPPTEAPGCGCSEAEAVGAQSLPRLGLSMPPRLLVQSQPLSAQQEEDEQVRMSAIDLETSEGFRAKVLVRKWREMTGE